MKKQLGLLTSLLLFAVSMLLWTGCSKRNCDRCPPSETICNPCRPVVCPPPCKPVCPEPRPQPSAPAGDENSSAINSEGENSPNGVPPYGQEILSDRDGQYPSFSQDNIPQQPYGEQFVPSFGQDGPPQQSPYGEQFDPTFGQNGNFQQPYGEQFAPNYDQDGAPQQIPYGEEFAPNYGQDGPPQQIPYGEQFDPSFGQDGPQMYQDGPQMYQDRPEMFNESGMYPQDPSSQDEGSYVSQYPPQFDPNRPNPGPNAGEPSRVPPSSSFAEPCRPPCEPSRPCPSPCGPTCREACPPRCAAPLKPCKYGPSGECSSNGVTVRAKNPRMCMLGDQYPLDLEITACCDVCEVILSTTLPEGVTFMRSQPEAKIDGRELTWQIGSMTRCQTIPARIWLKCEREGDLCTCFCIKATPVAFCALLCAKPVLVCEKCGPAEVNPGEPINYTITVTNIGTCTAESVVVSDILPDGVEHASCQRTLNFKLGNLEPCQTKRVSFCVTSCKRGKICNTAIVSACNANQTSCEFCTCVACCAIECQKVGPKEIPVGQNANYQVIVVNTGDKTLHEVVVTDIAPATTSIVAAPGANICCKQAVWKLRELKPGERVNFNITLTTCTPGCFTNRVSVTNCEACNSCCEFSTQWKGRPAYDICIQSSDNPICLGETSRFKIIVTNKGQEFDSNINVVVNFPTELSPISASGASGSQVSGQSVVFSPFPNLAPRQTLEYYVTVKANGRGDLRPKVQVSSDFIKNPITQEESLIVN